MSRPSVGGREPARSRNSNTERKEREIPRVEGAHVRLERLPSTGVVRGEAREQLAATGGALSGRGGGGDLRTDSIAYKCAHAKCPSLLRRLRRTEFDSPHTLTALLQREEQKMPLIEMEELEKYDCIDAHLIALHLIVCFFFFF